jgi:PIN domain.
MIDGYLLDTNAASVLWDRRHRSYPQIRAFLKNVASFPVLISTVVLAEVEYGLKIAPKMDMNRQNDVRNKMAKFPLVLDIDRHTITSYSDLRSELFKKYSPKKRRGKLTAKRPEDLIDRTTAKELGVQENDIWIAAQAIQYNLIPIPREIMEKNRKNPPPFLEVAVLEAEPVYRSKAGETLTPALSQGERETTVDIKLTKFLPSLAEAPSKELEVLKERAIKSGFDFIDFWAVDFDWHEGKPFEHHWQDYRTRKDRSLKTVSTFGYDKYLEKGKYTACVKVIDVFGCDTSITVEINI